MPQSTEKLVEFVHRCQFSSLPIEVTHEIKRIFLDSIACALYARDSDKGRGSLKRSQSLGTAEQATVIGCGGKFPGPAAAFANGELINALDYDAVLSPGHVTPYVLPAPLAMGEMKRSSGKELILSLALAHEIAARVALALRGQRKLVKDQSGGTRVGFSEIHGHSSTIFGGTAAVCKIRGFDPAQTAHALGIAGHICPVPSFMKWAMVGPQTMTKYLLAGWMAEAELAAVSLVEAGYLGDTSVLDSEYGFWKYYGSDRWNLKTLFEGLGSEWSLLKTAYKPYPCCQMMHTGLDCFYSLIEENDLSPDEIEGVIVSLDPITVQPIWCVRKMKSDIDAQFSVPYVFAVAAHRIKIGPAWQHPRTLRDPKILDFMGRVKHQPHPLFDKVMLEEPGTNLAKVEIRARGKVFVEERKLMKGSPVSPATRMKDEDLIRKYKESAECSLPKRQIDQALALMLHLEKVKDISLLMSKLRPGVN